VLASVTIATLSMAMDAVPRYSHDAFFVGIALTILLSVVVGVVLNALRGSRHRLLGTLVLPTAAGGVIGMVVQGLVLNDVGTSWSAAIKDLGGLVDTASPLSWVLAGVILGGLPALCVTVFLLLGSRALRRLTGHDAAEGFSVAFTGMVGVLAGLGLVLVDDIAIPPLFIVMIASAISLLVALLVDGARIQLLRRVFNGPGADGFDIVPLDQFARTNDLAPVVGNAAARSWGVLVRVGRGDYRSAAAEPIALVADSEDATLRPLLRRRIAATCMLLGMAGFGALSLLAHR
jgi:hypothetical protein